MELDFHYFMYTFKLLLKVSFLNQDNELKLNEIELEQLKLELSQLNDLKNYTH